MEVLRVEESLDGQRLDIVLASHEKVSSRAEAQKIIKLGHLTVNESDEKITAKRIVKSGDVIEFTILPPPPSDLVPVAHPLDIVYEDDLLIVLNKPSGMVVHPSAGHFNDTLVNYLLHHTRLAKNDPVRPGIVHRIDKDTSGLLVVAKDLKTHEHLAKQFFHHTVKREYEAIVWGVPKQPSGRIEAALGRHPVDRKKFAVRQQGKQAVTHWKVVKKFKYLSLIACRLETGRTHQIRIHMSSIGYPLLGDSTYGRFRNYEKKISSTTLALLKAYQGQALHAKKLGFIHPGTGQWMHFESDNPKEMQAVISALESELQNVP